CVKRQRRSRVLPTKAEAAAWALRQEAELSGQVGHHTLAEAMARYAREVAPKHRGERWERLRLDAIARCWDCARHGIATITGPQVASWREDRLREVSPATVARELTLLRGVFEAARRDWGWIKTNPMQGLRWPKSPPA